MGKRTSRVTAQREFKLCSKRSKRYEKMLQISNDIIQQHPEYVINAVMPLLLEPGGRNNETERKERNSTRISPEEATRRKELLRASMTSFIQRVEDEMNKSNSGPAWTFAELNNCPNEDVVNVALDFFGDEEIGKSIFYCFLQTINQKGDRMKSSMKTLLKEAYVQKALRNVSKKLELQEKNFGSVMSSNTVAEMVAQYSSKLGQFACNLSCQAKQIMQDVKHLDICEPKTCTERNILSRTLDVMDKYSFRANCPRTLEIEKAVHELMDRILAEAEALHSCFCGATLEKVGSYRAGTRVSPFPDEFDFVLVLLSTGLTLERKGKYLAVMVQEDSPVWPKWSQCLRKGKSVLESRENGYHEIEPKAFWKYYFKVMLDIMEDIDLPDGFSHGGVLSPQFSGLAVSSTAVTLTLNWHLTQPITIDLSPGFPFPITEENLGLEAVESITRLAQLAGLPEPPQVIHAVLQSNGFWVPSTTVLEAQVLEQLGRKSQQVQDIRSLKLLGKDVLLWDCTPDMTQQVEEIRDILVKSVSGPKTSTQMEHVAANSNEGCPAIVSIEGLAYHVLKALESGKLNLPSGEDDEGCGSYHTRMMLVMSLLTRQHRKYVDLVHSTQHELLYDRAGRIRAMDSRKTANGYDRIEKKDVDDMQPYKNEYEIIYDRRMRAACHLNSSEIPSTQDVANIHLNSVDDSPVIGQFESHHVSEDCLLCFSLAAYSRQISRGVLHPAVAQVLGEPVKPFLALQSCYLKYLVLWDLLKASAEDHREASHQNADTLSRSHREKRLIGYLECVLHDMKTGGRLRHPLLGNMVGALKPVARHHGFVSSRLQEAYIEHAQRLLELCTSSIKDKVLNSNEFIKQFTRT